MPRTKSPRSYGVPTSKTQASASPRSNPIRTPSLDGFESSEEAIGIAVQVKRKKNAVAQASFRVKRKVVIKSLETSVDGLELLVQDYQEQAYMFQGHAQAALRQVEQQKLEVQRLSTIIKQLTKNEAAQPIDWVDNGPPDYKAQSMDLSNYLNTTNVGIYSMSNKHVPLSRSAGNGSDTASSSFEGFQTSFGPSLRPIQGTESNVRGDLDQHFGNQRFGASITDLTLFNQSPNNRRHSHGFLLPPPTPHDARDGLIHLPPPYASPPSSLTSTQPTPSPSFVLPPNSSDCMSPDSDTRSQTSITQSSVNSIHLTSGNHRSLAPIHEHRRAISDPSMHRHIQGSWSDLQPRSGALTPPHPNTLSGLETNGIVPFTGHTTLETIKRLAQTRKSSFSQPAVAKDIAYSAMGGLVDYGNAQGLRSPRRWVNSRRKLLRDVSM